MRKMSGRPTVPDQKYLEKIQTNLWEVNIEKCIERQLEIYGFLGCVYVVYHDRRDIGTEENSAEALQVSNCMT